MGAKLGLDRGLIDQHDGDVVLHRINPVTLCTFESFGILAVLERLLASRTNQHFQEVFGNHDWAIVRQCGRAVRWRFTANWRPLARGVRN